MSTVEPNVANIFAGAIAIYIANTGTPQPLAAGSPPPFFTAKPAAADWLSAGFARVGFTENGLELVSTPATKDFTPDELITPALTLVTGVKVEAKCTLWETQAENLARGIALAVLSNPGLGIKTVGLGSGNPLKEFVIGAQGPSANGTDTRVLMMWRVNVLGAITQAYSRKDISKLPCTFNGLSDSSKPTGYDVYAITDFGAGS